MAEPTPAAAPHPEPPAQAQTPAQGEASPQPQPRRRDLRPLVIVASFAAGLGLGYGLWGLPADRRSSAQATGEPTRYEVSTDDDPSLGPSDAPITLIEFSDYNCPFCRKWYEETLPVLLDEFGEDIRFVYRDLPVVGGGAVGLLAAQAANCAGDQDAYWEFQEALFGAEFGLSREAYLAYADRLGLDQAALAECLDSGFHEDEVRADLADAYSLGIGSTPTFFINGIPIVGARPTEIFLALIESELSR